MRRQWSNLFGRRPPVSNVGRENISNFKGKFPYSISRVADVYYNEVYKHEKQNKIPGMSLLIDFEKAFDSDDFGFILTTSAVNAKG